jgi:hypothetical protein
MAQAHLATMSLDAQAAPTCTVAEDRAASIAVAMDTAVLIGMSYACALVCWEVSWILDDPAVSMPITWP